MTVTPESQEDTQTTRKGPKVAIVGSGVIGLHCALEVVRKGGTPTIYESGVPTPYPFDWVRPDLDEIESEHPINDLRIKALGGTTLHWGGTVPRLERHEYAEWLSEEAYGVAEGYLGVFTHPPSWFEENHLIPAADSLDWGTRYWRNTSNPSRCRVYSTCSPNCPAGARYSPLQTWEALRPYNVHIATDIEIRNLDELREDNDLVIVAAGTIESTRLALIHGIEADIGFAHGVVLTHADSPVKTGGFRIGYPTVKVIRPAGDIFVDPTAGMAAPEWIARGLRPEGFGFEFVLASHTHWGIHNSIHIELSEKQNAQATPIPKVWHDLDEGSPFGIMNQSHLDHLGLIEAMESKQIGRWYKGISWDHVAGTLRTNWNQGDLLFLGNAALPTIGKANPTLTSLAFAIQELRKRL